MTNDEFWKSISLIDIEALDEGDEETAVEALSESISSNTEEEINQFYEILSQYLYKLDGKVWCDESGESSNSSDGFLYARCYVVAKGRDYYESVLNDPRLMPKSCEQWAESLIYVAGQAWGEVTGNDEEDYEFEPSVSYETGSNDNQW